MIIQNSRRVWIIVLLMCVCCVAVRIAAEEKDMKEGLIGSWSFEENSGDTAEDTSGKGNDGKINGAKRVKGLIGSCLEFDGKDDHVNMDSITGDMKPFTVEFWLNPFSRGNWTQALGAGGEPQADY